MTTEWLDYWKSDESDKLDSLFETNEFVAKSVLEQLNARKNNIVVEFGCGRCNLLSLIDKSVNTFGIDFSENRVKNFDKNKILINDCFDVYLKDDSVDRSFCFSLFNFLTLEEAIATIEEMIRITKKGGFILVGDIFKEDYERTFYLKMRENKIKSPSVSFYNKKTLEKVIESMIPKDSKMICYDTKIESYCNNHASFNFLIWKQ